VNRAVAEVGKVTQQNAATSEESNRAAAVLSSHSIKLAQTVGSLEIERGTVAAPAPRRLPAPRRQTEGTSVTHPTSDGA
jgi:methyl-accepting chemotaxis protein